MALALLIAFLCGVVPAFIWLFFWLMEDRCEPEPKRYLFYTFFCGMLAVFPALFLEKWAGVYTTDFALVILWAPAIEELFKFGGAYLAALRYHVFDEPLDAIIYMATAALGFSAMENALFLFLPVFHGEILRSVVTEDLRFMGATVLHTLTSTTVGLMLAFSFYKPSIVRKWYAVIGLILAVGLHALFNFFILQEGSDETLWIFLCLWFGVIAMLLMTERIKQPKDYC